MHDALSSVSIHVLPATSEDKEAELVGALAMMITWGVEVGTQRAQTVDVPGDTLVGEEEDHFGSAHKVTGLAADGVETGQRRPAVTNPPRLWGLDGGRSEVGCGTTQVRGAGSLPTKLCPLTIRWKQTRGRGATWKPTA